MEKRSDTVLKTKTKRFQFLLFRGVDFRCRSSPAQVTPARASCFSRCTTSPAIYWFLNHPKRSSNGVVIVFPSSVQKLFSVFGPVSLFRRLVFQRAFLSCPCIFSNQTTSIRLTAQPSCQTCGEPRRSISRLVAIDLQSCNQQVFQFSVQVSFFSYQVSLYSVVFRERTVHALRSSPASLRRTSPK
jgi:hypothetical protein